MVASHRPNSRERRKLDHDSAYSGHDLSAAPQVGMQARTQNMIVAVDDVRTGADEQGIRSAHELRVLSRVGKR
jgi:hypothetical protein